MSRLYPYLQKSHSVKWCMIPTGGKKMSENAFSRGVLHLNHACFLLGYKEESEYQEGGICLGLQPPCLSIS